MKKIYIKPETEVSLIPQDPMMDNVIVSSERTDGYDVKEEIDWDTESGSDDETVIDW